MNPDHGMKKGFSSSDMLLCFSNAGWRLLILQNWVFVFNLLK